MTKLGILKIFRTILRPRRIACLLCNALWLVFPTMAQEGVWSVRASGGISVLSFRSVDEEGRRDIAAFNRLGYPIADYPPLRSAPSVEANLRYRFDRDTDVSLFFSYMRATTATMLNDSARFLSLDRKLTSTDFGIDFSYYFPPLVYDAELSAFLGLGRMTGHADQTTKETRVVKSADSTITEIVQDAFAGHTKSKLYVRIGVQGTILIVGPVHFAATVVYKYAPIGKLDGILREFSVIRPYTTSIEFNYSTLEVKAGVEVRL